MDLLRSSVPTPTKHSATQICLKFGATSKERNFSSLSVSCRDQYGRSEKCIFHHSSLSLLLGCIFSGTGNFQDGIRPGKSCSLKMGSRKIDGEDED